MSSIQQIVGKAKKAYRACSHVEQEWLARELGSESPEGDLDVIQDALGDIMLPEQFATPWEKKLYDALSALMNDLSDTEDDRHPETGKIYTTCQSAYVTLRQFSKEQERRLEARIQMEAYQTNH